MHSPESVTSGLPPERPAASSWLTRRCTDRAPPSRRRSAPAGGRRRRSHGRHHRDDPQRVARPERRHPGRRVREDSTVRSDGDCPRVVGPVAAVEAPVRADLTVAALAQRRDDGRRLEVASTAATVDPPSRITRWMSRSGIPNAPRPSAASRSTRRDESERRHPPSACPRGHRRRRRRFQSPDAPGRFSGAGSHRRYDAVSGSRATTGRKFAADSGARPGSSRSTRSARARPTRPGGRSRVASVSRSGCRGPPSPRGQSLAADGVWSVESRRQSRASGYSSKARFMMNCENSSLRWLASSSPMNGDSWSPAISRENARSRVRGVR